MKEDKKRVKVGNREYAYTYKKSSDCVHAKVWDAHQGKQVSVYAKNITELKRKIRDKVEDIEKKSKPMTSLTVKKYFLTWLYDFKKGTVKPTTFDKCEQMVRCHIIPELGHIKMNQIKDIDIQKLLNKMNQTHAYSAVKKVKEPLTQVFKFAVQRGDLEHNPMDTVKMPIKSITPANDSVIKYYTDDEMTKMVSTIIEEFDERQFFRISVMFVFLANTGLRIGECLALKHEDIDLDNRYVYINKGLTRFRQRDENGQASDKYSIDVTTPKTKTSTRKVELNSTAIWAINELKRRDEIMGVPDGEFFFRSQEGNHFCNRSLEDTMKRICKRAEIPYYGLHALRHTFASNCFRMDVPIEVVSKLLGHSSVLVTQNVYVHILPEQRRDAVDRLDALNILYPTKYPTINE